MTWENRIREGAYTGPQSGTRLTFQFENVSRSVSKKTEAFTFPEVAGTYVQDLGQTGRRYPLRLFFTGPNCDRQAQAFEALLLERGPGLLEHPFYGEKVVVPFGDITLRDDLKTAANQSIIEVTFWETLQDLYPLGAGSPRSAVVAALEDTIATSAEAFTANISTDRVSEGLALEQQFEAALGRVDSVMTSIADATEEVGKKFNAVKDSITAAVDTLVGDPLTIAFQVGQLMQLPGQAAASIGAKFDAYGNLLDDLLGNEDTVAMPGIAGYQSNAFHTANLYASGAVAGAVVSVVNTDFATRSDAIVAAEGVLYLWDQLTTWQDDNFESLEQIDTGESYQQLQEAVVTASAFLVELSFNLQQERAIVLQNPRSPIDLAAELYGGDVDETLDFFITSNDLVGTEIYEIPAGRRVVWFQ